VSPVVRGSTRVLGVIGWPVTHSLSPAIHNAAIDALGLDLVYVALPVPPGEAAEALDGLRSLGLLGVNVTMPHKTDVAHTRTEDADRLDAVNTVVITDVGLGGHNTDAPGFDRMLRHDEGFDPAGAEVLLYGAGGAARACALALARGGAARITVALRDPTRSALLERAVEGLGTPVTAVPFDRAPDRGADLIVNATPLGAHGEDLPTPALGPGVVVIDLLYHEVTPILARAREAGATTAGGLGLLLHQAALSFELWTGQVPPLDVMSAAAVVAAAERP
jgi:shikimate dehydrogenase